MTIHTTQWRPDTCSCVIEYSWDDSQPEDSRTHTLTRVVEACPEHQGTEVTTWNTVNEENPRKNIGLQIIIDNAPAQFVDVGQDGTKTLKSGLTLDFTVAGKAPNRVFTLIFKGQTLTQTQMNTVQTRLDNRFGTGKVIFTNPS